MDWRWSFARSFPADSLTVCSLLGPDHVALGTFLALGLSSKHMCLRHMRVALGPHKVPGGSLDMPQVHKLIGNSNVSITHWSRKDFNTGFVLHMFGHVICGRMVHMWSMNPDVFVPRRCFILYVPLSAWPSYLQTSLLPSYSFNTLLLSVVRSVQSPLLSVHALPTMSRSRCVISLMFWSTSFVPFL